MVLASKLDDCDQVTVSYERFRKVCPQCNTVVHAMELSRSMRLRKVCPQYSYRSAREEVSLTTMQYHIA